MKQTYGGGYGKSGQVGLIRIISMEEINSKKEPRKERSRKDENMVKENRKEQ